MRQTARFIVDLVGPVPDGETIADQAFAAADPATATSLRALIRDTLERREVSGFGPEDDIVVQFHSYIVEDDEPVVFDEADEDRGD